MSGGTALHYWTRRRFLSASSLALAAGAAGRISLLGQQPPQSPPTVFTPLRRNVGVFTGQGGTIGWFVDAKAVVVIDSQFPATARTCLEGINERSGSRPVDYLINTHHHGDHTAGNGEFRAAARKIVAHERVPDLQLAAAARQANPAPQTVADTTFAESWRADLGDEVVSARHYGPAHTGGDIAIHFEKANVVHMGDLMFNRRHPFIDRPSGARISGWITVLEKIAAGHPADTLYIFGHAGQGWEVTGDREQLLYQRDYFTALLEHVQGGLRAGRSREEIVKDTSVLGKFKDHGPLIERVLTVAHEELTAEAAG